MLSETVLAAAARSMLPAAASARDAGSAPPMICWTVMPALPSSVCAAATSSAENLVLAPKSFAALASCCICAPVAPLTARTCDICFSKVAATLTAIPSPAPTASAPMLAPRPMRENAAVDRAEVASARLLNPVSPALAFASPASSAPIRAPMLTYADATSVAIYFAALRCRSACRSARSCSCRS